MYNSIMELVVDTSVIVAILADEPEKPVIIEKSKGFDLVAPASVPWEVGNAFSAMLKRRRVGPESVMKAIGIFQSIPLRWVDVDLSQSVRLAAELKIYAYDAYLLQCALERRCPLISLDAGLLRHARSRDIELVEVS